MFIVLGILVTFLFVMLPSTALANGDFDGIPDYRDNCPRIYNPDQADLDGDGTGDVCDSDDDNDGIFDAHDNCPIKSNPDQVDLDGDGIGDVCDATVDADGDGFSAYEDCDDAGSSVYPGAPELCDGKDRARYQR